MNSTLHAALTALQDTTVATAIRENDNLFPWVESVHVLAITLVVGTIAVVDLRLLGLASKDRPVLSLSRNVLICTWIAFAVASVSGGLLFSAKALAYSGNFFFQAKLALLALAGVNMASFHSLFNHRMGDWGPGVAPPLAARMSAGLSLLIWAGIVGFGRWIGFTLH